MEFAKGPFTNGVQGFRSDPATPERFSEPVTDLGGMLTRGDATGIHIQADAADDLIVDGDSEVGLGLLLTRDADPLFRILQGIGMWDAQHVARNAVATDVVGDRLSVTGTERADRGFGKRELHGLIDDVFGHAPAERILRRGSRTNGRVQLDRS